MSIVGHGRVCYLSVGVVVVKCQLYKCVLQSIQLFYEPLVLSSSLVDLACSVNVLSQQEVVWVFHLSSSYSTTQ